ncbi:MAG: hypothetical protein JO051_06160 [Acidobacteriaceae bacterium]|nr:hypothetical protein [Acidobacteriaceae bacterium]
MPGEMDALVVTDGATVMLQDVGLDIDAKPVAVHVVLVTMLASAQQASTRKLRANRIIGMYYT